MTNANCNAQAARLLCLLWLAASSLRTLVAAEAVDGFTEPFRTVQVATAETGLLQLLNVQLGDSVKQGQVLGTLDDDLQRAQLLIAQQQSISRGRLKAAEAERAVNERRYEKLAQLVAKGHASTEEVERAEANLHIAQARLLSEQEEVKLLELHLERARLALEKRSIRAPLNGIVSTVHRQVGEIVSPAAPQLVTIVELDPLAATFLVSRPQVQSLQNLKQVRVHLTDSNQHAIGTVESIAPVTDAESGTTAVRIRLANPASKLRGGERCRLELP
jgi:RND family efflux transporter MFP subunit